jgi:hypothetical protein
MTIKRYVLFAGDIYYPCGGMGDFIDDNDEMQPLIDRALSEFNGELQWYHIVEHLTLDTVYEYGKEVTNDTPQI